MYKIEENNKIMDIVELILYSNDQNQDQQRKGLKTLTPDQMLSRLPVSFAQLNAGNNVEKLKGALSGLRQFLAIEIPSKMLFISPPELFPFSRYLNFCVTFLVM